MRDMKHGGILKEHHSRVRLINNSQTAVSGSLTVFCRHIRKYIAPRGRVTLFQRLVLFLPLMDSKKRLKEQLVVKVPVI